MDKIWFCDGGCMDGYFGIKKSQFDSDYEV